MSTLTKVLLVSFFAGYLFIHLYTISINPLPWFDETFFASISKSVAEHGTLIPEIAKETYPGEYAHMHGPVHFLLEATSFKFFGFGIFQYRIITFLFGLLTIIATALLIYQNQPSLRILILSLITFSLDPFLNLSMHEGRMDLVTVFFMLLSILFIVKASKEEEIGYYIFSGVWASIAILTTPRIGFIYIAAGIALLFSLEGKPLKQSLLKLFWWMAPVLILYTAWAYYAFGGYVELYQYYANIKSTHANFIGGKWYIPRHEYLVITLSIFAILYGIIKEKLSYFSSTTIVALLSIGFFYLIVFDYGPYSMLILPFYYFLFFKGFDNPKLSRKNLSMYSLLILLVFNLSFFTIKSIHIFSEAEIRRASHAEDFVQKNIPPGSKVIGDPQFYYAVVKAGSHYRLYDEFLSDESREKILREVYDYDYFILSDRYLLKHPRLAELYFKNARLKKVAEFKMGPSEMSKKINALGIVSSAESYGYSAQLFVRIKEDKSWVGMVEEK